MKGQPSLEDVEIESFERLQVEAYMAGIRLRSGQVKGIREWVNCNGVLCPVPVGGGKAGLGLLIAQDALVRLGHRKVLWILPVNLVVSLVKSHIPQWRKWIGLPFNFHYFSGRGRAGRMQLARSGAAGVYVLPYSLLSTHDTIDVLQELNADVVIADEAHRLKNLRAAGPRRLFDWIKSRLPAPKACFMSGSFMRKSILDFHHQAVAALHDKTPVPISKGMAFSWSLVLDTGAAPLPGMTEATLKPLMDWAGVDKSDPDAPRKAFQKRLLTAPGVVSIPGERPDASLLIHEVECGKPNQKLMDLMAKVQKGETPDGDPIDHAIHEYKWLHELSAGFYNSLRWPTPEQLAKSREIPVEVAAEQLEAAKDHHEAEKVFHSEAREFFKNPPERFDTPALLGLGILQGKIQGEIAELWKQAKSLEWKGMPSRLSVPVRVCDHKVIAALGWAQSLPKGEGGIIWTYHRDIGAWIFQVLKDFGMDPVFCPAGTGDLIESLGDPARGGLGNRLVVASQESHAEGRNLQAFRNQLFVQWPRGVIEAEQLLGRLHRSGQMADEVLAGVLISTEFDELNRAACLSDSVVVQLNTGQDQKVIYADYDPLPKVLPPEVLRARGMRPEDLGARGREFVQGRFGKYTRDFKS